MRSTLTTVELKGAEQASHVAFEGRLLRAPLLVCFPIMTK
jgi:hypothetical protein